MALTPGAQAAGWGTGAGYMLETDARGDLRIEHGDEHRKVFVTGGEHGLSAREIARAEGLDLARMEGKWGAWLAAHPAYGWAGNKGYGAAAHRRAILERGATEHHRYRYLVPH